MFKLKNKEMLFGINKEASEHGTPVFEKQLGDGIQADANRDGTRFVHLDQMAQGKLGYTADTVTWKKDTRSPARVYTRQTMPEGAYGLPWEAEAYQKTKK